MAATSDRQLTPSCARAVEPGADVGNRRRWLKRTDFQSIHAGPNWDWPSPVDVGTANGPTACSTRRADQENQSVFCLIATFDAPRS